MPDRYEMLNIHMKIGTRISNINFSVIMVFDLTEGDTPMPHRPKREKSPK
jgi:hypothetical protein